MLYLAYLEWPFTKFLLLIMMEYLNSINQLKTGFFDFIPIEVLLFIPIINLIQGFYFFNSKFFLY